MAQKIPEKIYLVNFNPQDVEPLQEKLKPHGVGIEHIVESKEIYNLRDAPANAQVYIGNAFSDPSFTGYDGDPMKILKGILTSKVNEDKQLRYVIIGSYSAKDHRLNLNGQDIEQAGVSGSCNKLELYNNINKFVRELHKRRYSKTFNKLMGYTNNFFDNLVATVRKKHQLKKGQRQLPLKKIDEPETRFHTIDQ
ncbi:hypothetical protein JXA85_04215 [Candidatus Woesearchaeota archaeon]|nr:hypothetical protein [Candidatus Woesearchaeota archaeon]